MKRIFSLLCFLFFLSFLTAQEKEKSSKHFISFRTGYSIPVSPSQIGSPRSEIGKTYVDKVSNSSGNTVSYSEKNSFGSRGAGLNFSLGYGYMFLKNVSFEVDFSYLYTLGITDAYINDVNVSNKLLYNGKQTSYTSMFRMSPMIGVYANENLIVRPYAKFGIILPLAGGTYADLTIEDNTGVAFEDLMPMIDKKTYDDTKALGAAIGFPNLIIPTKTDISAVTKGSFSVGFLGRLGAEYNFKNLLNNKLTIFAEMEMQMLTIKAHKTIIKSFYSTVNDKGLKQIAEDSNIKTEFTEADIPTILLETDYIKEITELSNATYDINSSTFDRDKALEQLTFRDNYNAFGFLVGLKYTF